MKKLNLKSVFWVQEFGHPNQYTSLTNNLNTTVAEEIRHTIDRTCEV